MSAVDRQAVNAAANYLRIVSHPGRLAIALLLHGGPCAVSEIESALGLRQPNLSQHLGILRDANILTASRRAKSVVYELAPGLAADLVGAIRATMQIAPAVSTAANSVLQAAAASPKSSGVSPAEPDDALMFAHVIGRRTQG